MTETGNWTRIDYLGSFFTVEDGHLLQAPMNSDGSFDTDEACQALNFSNAEDELFVLRALLGIHASGSK